jgi:hypothetical protein
MKRDVEDSARLGANHFDGSATGFEFWFEYLDFSSEMFARSRLDLIPRTTQVIRTKKTMIMVSFTTSKLIVLDVLPKGRNFNQLYLAHNIFPDLKKENTRSRRCKPGSTFWAHMDNLLFHNGSRLESKFPKDHL